MTDRYRDVHAFVAELPSWDDFTLITAVVLGGVVPNRGPDAEALAKGMSAERERRGLTDQVDSLIAAAKAEGEPPRALS